MPTIESLERHIGLIETENVALRTRIEALETTVSIYKALISEAWLQMGEKSLSSQMTIDGIPVHIDTSGSLPSVPNTGNPPVVFSSFDDYDLRKGDKQ